ncbi:CGNR zinc finger domain-containing protein [Actinoplanes bogorensis]|uniref:CGNR zinc finger domain-containing protein n=1 Tax=Paractinoplanes bogorensis TaxID=1610840 RepID=A0ABS5Z0B1_9ACTN|nr:CGNR zinc finger domain-containing protein [Actinoplanes bogorensis]MBU2669083.1 CGNR zinc finger domain-containing protein [Actinoplanes bogorensis]
MSVLQLIEEFLNTVDERTFSRHGQTHVAGDELTSPQALRGWIVVNHLPPGESELGPDDLAATVELRSALRRSLLGDPDADVILALAGHPLRVEPDPAGGLRIAAHSGRPWLNVIVETVAGSAARGDWHRIKLCAAPDCRWAFHDTSRNGRGRWCEMEVCGNRHKTRTYRERHQT